MLRKLTPRSPLEVAQALVRHGLRAIDVGDGDDTQDGDVTVAGIVHVEVPTFGGPPRVVAEAAHAGVRCYPPRASVAELAQDIRDALNDIPSAALGGCSIH